ncbi:MAG: HEPN domain-containing protein [Planctomycetota bacterium]|nr:HEPN domain-containing protein [Planctomycetota bacterium]
MKAECFMEANPEAQRVAAEWVAKAENDLRTAALTLRAEGQRPTDTICFHAQQCIEKYLKALLVLNGSPFPRTHDLTSICALLPDAWRPDVPPAVLERFTDYATVTRYPGDYTEIPVVEARAALATARKIRKAARAILPTSAKRAPRRH